MVGDKMATDILGAKKAGIPSALVKTGEFKDADLDCDLKPDYILDSIKDFIKLF
jgi:ribonucleotide monophosphatase NagD (HAD superfamily)